MYNPTQTSLYLEYISLLKAKLVTFRCTKVVKSNCFHPESTELEVKPDPRRSMWVDVPPENTERRKGWNQRASTLKQTVRRHCALINELKEWAGECVLVSKRERQKKHVGGRQGWQFLSQRALIEGNTAMWETGKLKKWWEDDEKNGLSKTSPHQRAGPAYYK